MRTTIMNGALTMWEPWGCSLKGGIYPILHKVIPKPQGEVTSKKYTYLANGGAALRPLWLQATCWPCDNIRTGGEGSAFHSQPSVHSEGTDLQWSVARSFIVTGHYSASLATELVSIKINSQMWPTVSTWKRTRKKFQVFSSTLEIILFFIFLFSKGAWDCV